MGCHLEEGVKFTEAEGRMVVAKSEGPGGDVNSTM